MTTAPPDSSDKPTPRRRWHTSAIAAAVLALAIGVFLNVPGDLVRPPDILDSSNTGPCFLCYPQYVAHGWPFPFMTHYGPPYDWRGLSQPFHPWNFGVSPDLDWWNLTGNIAVVLFGSLLVGWLTNRHVTKYGYGFGLANVAVLLFVIACLLGYATYRYRLQQAQLEFSFPAGVTGNAAHLEWQPFGPLWLRSLTGDKYWSWGDRLLAAEPHAWEDIETFPGNSTILVLRPKAINLDEPPSLEGYHRILAIDLSHTNHIGVGPPDDDGDVNLKPLIHQFAKCKTLQGLNLYDNGVTDRDLEELSTMPNLQHLDLSGNDRITDAGLPHLASLKSLRKLGLQQTGVTKLGVNKLKAELPNCYIHWHPWDNPNAIRLP